MDDLNISLSSAQAAFVDHQVAEGHYASASDYVAALIDAEAKAKTQQRLDKALCEGLDSPSTPWTMADTERLNRLASTGK